MSNWIVTDQFSASGDSVFLWVKCQHSKVTGLKQHVSPYRLKSLSLPLQTFAVTGVGFAGGDRNDKDGVWGVFNSMCSESLHDLPSSTKPHWSPFTPAIYLVMKWYRVGGKITFYNKEPTDSTSAASTSKASTLWQLDQWVNLRMQSNAWFLKSSDVYLCFHLNELARARICSGAKRGRYCTSNLLVIGLLQRKKMGRNYQRGQSALCTGP